MKTKKTKEGVMSASNIPCVLEQFQASSLLDGDVTKDLTNHPIKDFEYPSDASVLDGHRTTEISTYDPSGYLASPDGNIIMIRKANSGRMSPVMATSAKDYDEKMKALKHENFDLRLYCYHLEKKMQDETVDQTELNTKKYTIQLETDLAKLESQLLHKNELLKTASSAIDSLKSENDAFRRDLECVDSDQKMISEFRQRQEELISERDALERQLQHLRHQVAELQKGRDSNEHHSKVEESVTKLEQSNSILRQQLASSESQIKDLAQQLSDARCSNTETAIVETNIPDNTQSLKDEISSLNQRYERAVKAIQGFLKKVSKRDKEIDLLKAQLASEKHTSYEPVTPKSSKEVQVDETNPHSQILEVSLKESEMEAEALRSQLQETETERQYWKNLMRESHSSDATVSETLRLSEKSKSNLEKQYQDATAEISSLRSRLQESETDRMYWKELMRESYSADTNLSETLKQSEKVKNDLEKQCQDAAAEILKLKNRIEELTTARSDEVSRSAEMQEKYTSLLEGMETRLNHKEEHIKQLMDCLAARDRIMVESLQPAASSVTNELHKQLEEKESEIRILSEEKDLLISDFETARRELLLRIDEQTDMYRQSRIEADILQRQLADDEAMITTLKREMIQERSDRRRYEEMARQTTEEREKQLIELQEALAEQEVHVTTLTNKTEGASSALAKYEAVAADRARRLEDLLLNKESALGDALSELRNLTTRLESSESEVSRLRELLQKSEEGMVDRLERASVLLDARDRTIDNLLAETKILSASVVNASMTASNVESVQIGQSPKSDGDGQKDEKTAKEEDLHAEVARLKGLLTEKEEKLERLGTPHRGVGRRLVTLHALPAPSASSANSDQLSANQLHTLRNQIFTLLQTLERTQHLQESFFGNLLTTANESLLHHQQSVVERSLNEESQMSNVDQSIANLSGLSFLLSRLPRTPGGLEGGNVTMTTEGVTMSEEMHDLIFERLRDQVDELRKALALCSDQGHSLLNDTSGMGSPMRLTMDSEDWAGLMRRLLKRLETEDEGEKGTDAIHKDVRIAVGLCRQIINRLDKDEDEPAQARVFSRGDDPKGSLSPSDLRLSPQIPRVTQADLSRTVDLVRNRCQLLEEENRNLRSKLISKEEESMTSVSPYSTRGTSHDRSYHEKSLLEAPGTPRRRGTLDSSDLECEKLRSSATDLRRQLAVRCDDMEIARLRAEASEMQQRYSIAASELEVVTSERMKQDEEMTMLQKELDLARDASRRLQQEMGSETSRLRQEVADLSEELRRRAEIEERIVTIRTQMMTLEGENEKVHDRAEKAESDAMRLNAECDLLQRRLAEMESSLKAESERFAHERRSLIAQMEQSRLISHQELEDVRLEKDSLLQKVGHLQSQFHCSSEEAQKLMSEFSAQSSEMENRLASVATSRDELQKQLQSVKEEKVELEDQISCLIQIKDDAHHQIEILTRDSKADTERIENLKNELMKNMEESLAKEKSMKADIESLSETESKLREKILDMDKMQNDIDEENTRLRSLITKIEEDSRNEEERLNNVIDEKQTQMKALSDENSRMKISIIEFEDIEKTMRINIQQNENQVRQLIEEMEIQRSSYDKENSDLQADIRKLSEEACAYDLQIQRLQNEFESKRSMLETENSRLQELINNLESRSEEQKLHFQQAIQESESERVRWKEENESHFQQIVKESECEILRWKEEKEDIQRENNRLREEMTALTVDQERITEEKEELTESLELVRCNLESEQKKVDYLEGEIAKLRNSCDSVDEETRTLLTLKCELERRLEELTQQIEQRDKTISVLREENAEYYNSLEKIKPEMKNLKDSLDMKENLTIQLQEDLLSAHARVSDLQNQVEINSSQSVDVHQQNETILQELREENEKLKVRVQDLERKSQVIGKQELWSKDLREMGDQIKKLEGKIKDLLTENEKWKSAAKELRSKLDTRTNRLESYVKQNARLKALIKQDEQQAEERRADLEMLTSNVQVKNEAISRLQLQLRNLQKDVETSRRNINNSALSDLPQELPRGRPSICDRALTPTLSDVLSTTTEGEDAEQVTLETMQAKLRATECMNRSLQAEISMQSTGSIDEWNQEYLNEVRLLRGNLEASIMENDRLREALQRQLSHNIDQPSVRVDQEMKNLKERLALKKRQLSEAEERADLLQSEAELLRTELQAMKELVRSAKAEVELCRPREGSVRREIILESQRLRMQLERSIESNRRLQTQLKDQISQIHTRRSFSPATSTPRLHELSSRQEIPTRLSQSANEHMGDSIRVDSEMRLLHAICRLDDYELVRKEIQQSLSLVQSIRTRIDSAIQQRKPDSAREATEFNLMKDLLSEVKNITFVIEEENRIIGRFWVAELPPTDHKGRYYDPVTQNQLLESQTQVERLRGSNRLLQSMLTQEKRRLKDTDRARNELECALVERLSTTEQVLSVARDNFQHMADEGMNKTS